MPGEINFQKASLSWNFDTAVDSEGRIDEAEAKDLIAQANSDSVEQFLQELLNENPGRLSHSAKALLVSKGYSIPEPPAPVLPPMPNFTFAVPTQQSLWGDEGIRNPTVPSMPLIGKAVDVLRDANTALDADALNRSLNPLAQIAGRFEPGKTGALYEGKTVVPSRRLFQALAERLPAEFRVPALGAIPESALIRMPAHQFNIDGEPGNRVLFYGGQTGHSEIDAVAQAYGDEGFRLVKQMLHLGNQDHSAGDRGQGGTFIDVLKNGVGGTTHAGGFSGGYLNGEPVSIKSDWPSNYGRLDDNHKTYNAILYAIDYQGGVKNQIPKNEVLAYKHNADMWDAALGLIVPFTNEDPDARFRNYQYNPLDVFDYKSAVELANDAATLDFNAYKQKHGTFYCAEAQYSVANLGPQDKTLLKKSQFGGTKLGELIDAYQAAPGYEGMSADDRRKHPEIGWAHVYSEGLIDDAGYNRLKQANRLATYMEWVPEDVNGWQAYEPKEPNQLVATPMTVAGLAWSIVRRYFPAEEVSNALVEQVREGYRKGSDDQKYAIELMLGGHPPTSAEGNKVLTDYSYRAALGMIVEAVSSQDFKNRLFQQAGFAEIESTEDRQKVESAYSELMAAVKESQNQAELDRTFRDHDAKLRDLRVKRRGVPGDRLMLYAAPPTYSAYAQHDIFSGGTTVFRYVGNAQHEEQKAR